jgi:hypothetical protein
MRIALALVLLAALPAWATHPCVFGEPCTPHPEPATATVSAHVDFLHPLAPAPLVNRLDGTVTWTRLNRRCRPCKGTLVGYVEDTPYARVVHGDVILHRKKTCEFFGRMDGDVATVDYDCRNLRARRCCAGRGSFTFTRP